MEVSENTKWEALNRFGKKLRNQTILYGHSSQEADDAIQEAYLNILRYRHLKIDMDKLKALLTTIFQNNLRNIHRSGRRWKIEPNFDLESVSNQDSMELGIQYEYQAKKCILDDYLTQNANDTKCIVAQQYYVLGNSAAEIALKHGTSINTVYSQLSRFRTEITNYIRSRTHFDLL